LFHLASLANPCEGSSVNVIRPAWRVWLALFLGLAGGVDAAGKPPASFDSVSLSAFKLIAQRNIFDQNRSARTPRPVAAKPARAESFGLTGTLCSEKGPFAFFDGTSLAYRKVVKPGETIAGYKVTAIDPHGATLQSGNQKLEVRVGTQLRREDKGEWGMVSAPVAYASSPSRASPSSSWSRHDSNPDPRHKLSSRHDPARGADDGRLAKNDLKALMKVEKEIYAKGETKDFPKDEMSRLFKEEMKGLPKQDVKSVKEALKRLAGQ
jgi:hypothetical protein